MRIILLLSAICLVVLSNLIPRYSLSDEVIQIMGFASKPKTNTQNAAITPCNDLSFKYCQSKFNNATGLPDGLNYNNGTSFYNQIQALLQVSIPEILTLCNARTQFYQCLDSSYYPCLSLFGILQRGVDYVNAFDYTRTFMGLDFLCNAGFEEVVNQWDCLQGIVTTAPYLNCMKTFNESVNPNVLCPLVQTTGNCLNSVYNNACASKAAGFFGCENFRYTFDQTCYGLRCNVN